MPTWQYALVSLKKYGDAPWQGHIILPGQDSVRIEVQYLEQRMKVLTDLGAEGWELVSQVSTVQNSMSESIGWEWTLKRPSAT